MALWRVEQAAEYLGIRPKTLYEWVRKGQVPYRKIGFNVRFDQAELEEWAAAKSQPASTGRGQEKAADRAARGTPGAGDPDALRRLAGDASQLLRELERDLGTSLSYPQRRKLADLADRLEEATGP